MMSRVERFAVTTMLACAAMSAGASLAQNYPTKLIRFIVAYPPGGTSDMLARLIGSKLT